MPSDCVGTYMHTAHTISYTQIKINLKRLKNDKAFHLKNVGVEIVMLFK